MDGTPQAPVFDLDSIVDLDEVEVPLKDPVSGKPIGMTVVLAGPDHERRMQAQWSIQRATLKEMAARGGKIDAMDPERHSDQAREMLVACVLGWTTAAKAGQPFDYSPANVRTLIAKGWVRRQLEEALNDTARFTRRSESN